MNKETEYKDYIIELNGLDKYKSNSIFLIRKEISEYTHCINAKMYRLNNCGDYYEKEFLFEFYNKWDGCNHYHFFGEDYTDNDSDVGDSYYHLCGHNYIREMSNALLVSSEFTKSMIELDEDCAEYKQTEMAGNIMKEVTDELIL